MGKETNIAWTDATFNPWWGCEKVSPGCARCYADILDNRMHPTERHWGKNAPHRFFGDKHWDEVEYWNNRARLLKKTIKVFCGSMCDVFQVGDELEEPRKKLWNLIEETEHLTWLLLTKRPENISRMLPNDWFIHDFPDNVMLGVTVECQDCVNRLLDIEVLKGYPSGIFVSVEPMLGPVDFGDLWHVPDWVIVGGESGRGARPMDLEWARDLHDGCIEHKIPFFFKQIGGYPDKQDELSTFPLDLQVREFPQGLG